MVPIASRDLAGCIRSIPPSPAVIKLFLHHHSHLVLSSYATRINLWVCLGPCVQIHTSRTSPTAYWLSGRASDICTEDVRRETRKTHVNAANIVWTAYSVLEVAVEKASSFSRSYTWSLMEEMYAASPFCFKTHLCESRHRKPQRETKICIRKSRSCLLRRTKERLQN